MFTTRTSRSNSTESAGTFLPSLGNARHTSPLPSAKSEKKSALTSALPSLSIGSKSRFKDVDRRHDHEVSVDFDEEDREEEPMMPQKKHSSAGMVSGKLRPFSAPVRNSAESFGSHDEDSGGEDLSHEAASTVTTPGASPYSEKMSLKTSKKVRPHSSLGIGSQRTTRTIPNADLAPPAISQIPPVGVLAPAIQSKSAFLSETPTNNNNKSGLENSPYAAPLVRRHSSGSKLNKEKRKSEKNYVGASQESNQGRENEGERSPPPDYVESEGSGSPLLSVQSFENQSDEENLGPRQPPPLPHPTTTAVATLTRKRSVSFNDFQNSADDGDHEIGLSKLEDERIKTMKKAAERRSTSGGGDRAEADRNQNHPSSSLRKKFSNAFAMCSTASRESVVSPSHLEHHRSSQHRSQGKRSEPSRESNHVPYETASKMDEIETTELKASDELAMPEKPEKRKNGHDNKRGIAEYIQRFRTAEPKSREEREKDKEKKSGGKKRRSSMPSSAEIETPPTEIPTPTTPTTSAHEDERKEIETEGQHQQQQSVETRAERALEKSSRFLHGLPPDQSSPRQPTHEFDVQSNPAPERNKSEQKMISDLGSGGRAEFSSGSGDQNDADLGDEREQRQRVDAIRRRVMAEEQLRASLPNSSSPLSLEPLDHISPRVQELLNQHTISQSLIHQSLAALGSSSGSGGVSSGKELRSSGGRIGIGAAEEGERSLLFPPGGVSAIDRSLGIGGTSERRRQQRGFDDADGSNDVDRVVSKIFDPRKDDQKDKQRKEILQSVEEEDPEVTIARVKKRLGLLDSSSPAAPSLSASPPTFTHIPPANASLEISSSPKNVDFPTSVGDNQHHGELGGRGDSDQPALALAESATNFVTEKPDNGQQDQQPILTLSEVSSGGVHPADISEGDNEPDLDTDLTSCSMLMDDLCISPLGGGGVGGAERIGTEFLLDEEGGGDESGEQQQQPIASLASLQFKPATPGPNGPPRAPTSSNSASPRDPSKSTQNQDRSFNSPRGGGGGDVSETPTFKSPPPLPPLQLLARPSSPKSPLFPPTSPTGGGGGRTPKHHGARPPSPQTDSLLASITPMVDALFTHFVFENKLPSVRMKLMPSLRLSLLPSPQENSFFPSIDDLQPPQPSPSPPRIGITGADQSEFSSGVSANGRASTAPAGAGRRSRDLSPERSKQLRRTLSDSSAGEQQTQQKSFMDSAGLEPWTFGKAIADLNHPGTNAGLHEMCETGVEDECEWMDKDPIVCALKEKVKKCEEEIRILSSPSTNGS